MKHLIRLAANLLYESNVSPDGEEKLERIYELILFFEEPHYTESDSGMVRSTKYSETRMMLRDIAVTQLKEYLDRLQSAAPKEFAVPSNEDLPNAPNQ